MSNSQDVMNSCTHTFVWKEMYICCVVLFGCWWLGEGHYVIMNQASGTQAFEMHVEATEKVKQRE